MCKTEKITTEAMMVQLLFRHRPKSPTAGQLREALGKYLGDLEEIPYAEPAEKSTADMFMFPVLKYRAIFEDKPDGVPVMAAFLSSDIDSGIEVDDLKRRQFRDVTNGDDIIRKCKNTILVHTMLGRALPYIQNEMIVDTIGFDVFGGADVQIHFKNLTPGHVAAYAYNVASYQFENGFPIESGETIDSMDANGNIQVTPQWTEQYEDSMVGPPRTVLDVYCGEYAGGNR